MQKPTKKELSQVYFLNREIIHNQKRLQELKAFASGKAVEITGMPKGSCTTDIVGNCAAEMADLKNIISLNIQRCWYELNRLNRFIDSVEDSQMRAILTFRFVNGFTWQQVAANIGGGNTADGVRKTVNRYIEKK